VDIDRERAARALERLRGDPGLRARFAAAGREAASTRTWEALVPAFEEALRLTRTHSTI
jgi:hypothetical protein